MNQKFRTFLKSVAGYLAMAALIGGLGYFLMQVFNQGEILREITPDPGMTKHCTQNADGSVECSQAPTAPAVPAARDPEAPMYVTLGAE